MRPAAPLYVEARIRGSLDELWRLTQTPAQHQRWDLRFTSITYLERAGESEPQRFRYATRIGGLEVAGWGATVGARAGEGGRTSALEFGSDDPRALIRAGSGYWKYVPTEDGIRFITGYDYEVRWGAPGRVVDRFLFRPLLGWATAWSFDRLRLWIERGLDPACALRTAWTHAVATGAVAFVWLWHGLVPKLLGPHPDELDMLREAGVAEPLVAPLTMVVGLAEVVMGLLVVIRSRGRWPFVATVVLMVLALAGVLATAPERALGAFGPVSLNALVIAASVIALLSRDDLPSASHCLRSAP